MNPNPTTALIPLALLLLAGCSSPPPGTDTPNGHQPLAAPEAHTMPPPRAAGQAIIQTKDHACFNATVTYADGSTQDLDGCGRKDVTQGRQGGIVSATATTEHPDVGLCITLVPNEDNADPIVTCAEPGATTATASMEPAT